MKQLRTSISRSLLALAIAATTFATGPARAHDGMEDITGVILSVTDSSVSVKTAKGKTVAVKLDAKTEYTRGKAQAKQADLKPGERVVVHAMEMNEALTAHLVQLPADPKDTKKATK
ncbi:MAG: DUF5666 domain-containing protein [Acidobacteriota bacterium]